MGNALSSLVSELPEGPVGLSSESVRIYVWEGQTCPLDSGSFFTWLCLFSLCPVGGCSFNPRQSGECKDFTELTFEAHLEEKFCFMVLIFLES